MSHSPLRFAILGFGHHAVRRLLPAFARSEHAVVTGLWRRNLEAARQNASEYEITHCFESREELCASPDAMHRDDTLLALRHGKAVLCEKPLAMSADESREMDEAARAAGVLFGVAQNFRYNRSVDYLEAQIAEGTIGVAQLAHAEFSYPAHLSARRWIADGSLACGGPIGDVGVHCIDTLRYVLRSDVVSVTTLAATDAQSGDVEAVASMQLEMTNGIFATVTVSARAAYRTLIEVTGSDGVLIAENGLTVDRPVDVQLRRAGELIETKTLDNGDGYVRMLDGFAAAYHGVGEFRATGEDGVRNMQVLDAAYRSWKSGRRELVG